MTAVPPHIETMARIGLSRWRVVAIVSAVLHAAHGGALAQPASSSPATPPAERVPSYLPVVPAEPVPPAPNVYTPTPSARPGQFSPPANSVGPVTGYGTGGMQQLPGSGPNPPYPPGGLLH
jgi:hypothetical protein